MNIKMELKKQFIHKQLDSLIRITDNKNWEIDEVQKLITKLSVAYAKNFIS